MIQSDQLELGEIGRGKFKIAASMNLIKLGKNDGTFKTINLLFVLNFNKSPTYIIDPFAAFYFHKKICISKFLLIKLVKFICGD